MADLPNSQTVSYLRKTLGDNGGATKRTRSGFDTWVDRSTARAAKEFNRYVSNLGERSAETAAKKLKKVVGFDKLSEGDQGAAAAGKAFSDLRKRASESMSLFAGAAQTASAANIDSLELPKLEGLFSKQERAQNEKVRQYFDLRKEEILRRTRTPGLAQTRLVGLV